MWWDSISNSLLRGVDDEMVIGRCVIYHNLERCSLVCLDAMMTMQVQDVVIDIGSDEVLVVAVDFVEIESSMPMLLVLSRANEEKQEGGAHQRLSRANTI